MGIRERLRNGLGATAVPPAPTEPVEPTHYVNREWGLAFTVPAGLKLYTSSAPGPLKGRISSETPVIVVNPAFRDESVTIKVDDGVSASDLLEFKKMLDDKPRMPLPRYKRVSVGFCTIGRQDDKTAVEHVHFVQGNAFGKMRQVTFQHEGRGFTVTCGTSEDRFETANREFFEPMFATMEFLPLASRGPLNLMPLPEWPAMPLPQALDGLVRVLRSTPDKRYRVGPHPDARLKRSLCFLGGDFVETSENLPAELAAVAERTDDRKAVMAELVKLVGRASSHAPITHVGEITGDDEHLVLRTSTEASVVVERSRFDYLLAAHPGSKVLLVLPDRAVVAFVGNDGNDGLLLTTKE